MAKAHAKLQSMNVDALLKLRDDIGTVLSYKRQDLRPNCSVLVVR